MSSLTIGTAISIGRASPSTFTSKRRSRISCVGWDPEGILGPPAGGHIARLEFKKRLEKDAGAREAFERQFKEEQERRRAQREARVVPETAEGLVEYFLDTEAQELEIEISRLRPRLDKAFFDHLQFELGQLRFSVSKTKEVEDRLIELEALQKVLLEGTEAYDKMQADFVMAKQGLMKILQSKDRRATLLEMVEHNELNRSLLSLLDENIASALDADQKEVAAFMESVRASILKYLTV
ncbi:hypothetical protein QJS10_CPA08g01564 [Acorus calamus]|uniref:Uncharacterized protein n=1 Tax=Acorus calamus TaxID=4465 RepID=A0AAV9E7Z0_ACOCL|nr:hypothetical protein QJS10_CPA08g01564 [Acorus calamus]